MMQKKPQNYYDKIINDLDKVNCWYHKATENDKKGALYVDLFCL